MDLANSFPSAYPLVNAQTSTIVTALMEHFSNWGLCKELLSDNGTQFMSEICQVLLNKFGIAHIKISAYHPESNGQLETWHKSLKNMIRSLIADHPHLQWDDCLPYILWAYRETPNASTGFSPYELQFGRCPSTLLSLIYDKWTDTDPNSHSQNVIDYMMTLKDKLSVTQAQAAEHRHESKVKGKTWYDKRAKQHSYNVGQLVMVLLPNKTNKLQLKYQGPFSIVKIINDVDYLIEFEGTRKPFRIVHANQIKPYFVRKHNVLVTSVIEQSDHHDSCCSKDFSESLSNENYDESFTPIEYEATLNNNLNDVSRKLSHLDSNKVTKFTNLLNSFPDVFADKPGRTDVVEHDIILKPNTVPINKSPYRMSPHHAQIMKEHIKEMLADGIIRESDSEWSSSAFLVPKGADQWRPVIDFRYLNENSLSQPFPLPNIDDLINKIGRAPFRTKLDLRSAYYQIKLADKCTKYTAFSTSDGHYEFCFLPFGLKCSGWIFQKCINKVLSDLPFCQAFIDDIIIWSDDFESHAKHVEIVLERLRNAGLTVKLEKCEFGKASIDYLGYQLGDGEIRPGQLKVKALLEFPKPETKKTLQSFLGLTNFFSKFIPNYATLSSPLTDMLRKGQAFNWNAMAEQAFTSLKACTSREPVLSVPYFDRPFNLFVDVSEVAVGIVMTQIHSDNSHHAVLYMSKKLSLTQQRNYNTTMKEYWGILEAAKTFRVYLESPYEHVVYTDHACLTALHRASSSNRMLYRWSIYLSQFNLVIKRIAGKLQIADILSRPCWTFSNNDLTTEPHSTEVIIQARKYADRSSNISALT